jgi:SAM-dependent methyltransferase
VSDEGYLLDNQAGQAGQRFDALATLFDPSTFRHLTDLGIALGWSCWEIGAGGPSVPRWLAAKVGPTGRVLATDIDISWARAAADGIVEVREHDVAADEPPAESFDLVHARLVLVHVTDRDRALDHAVRSLRPGGCLLLEDVDPALQPLSCLADAYFPIANPACQLLEMATINHIRQGLVTNGLATTEEIERHLANVAGGRLDLAQPPMVSAWGRLP